MIAHVSFLYSVIAKPVQCVGNTYFFVSFAR